MSPGMKIVISAGALMAGVLAAPQGRAQAGGPADPGGSDQLAEIIVTAEKRSENLQQVPIAVTAIEGSTALALGVTDMTDLQVDTTGLIMRHQNNTLTPSLRGISTVNPAPGEESPIAVYVDGVYLAAPSSGIFSLSNIDSVEVLKGPQGTLFGRNAAGGVIQVTTKTPQQTPEAELSVGYGNYDTTEVDLYATTGITPNIATNLTVHWNRQYGGWGSNLTTGEDTFTHQYFALRNKWLLTPGDSTQITISADLENSEDPEGIPTSILPGTFASIGKATHVGGFYDVQENFPSNDKLHEWGLSANINQDFDWAHLVSISAYRDSTPRDTIDIDATKLNIIDLFGSYQLTQITQELQLLSAKSSPVKWIAGFFYLDNRSGYDQTLTGAGIGKPPAFSGTLDTITNKSTAGFGQATIPIYETTHLTAGLRYTYDQPHVVGGSYSVAGLVPGSATDQTASSDKLTWRFALDHQFTPEVMGYASYDRGYKSGVFNGTAPQNPAVRPSVIDAYEVGAKSEWLDNKLRVNGSAFYDNYDEVQLSISQGGKTELLNAAKAKIKGVDLDAEVIPLKRLTLSGGFSYVDARYTEFPNAPIATALPTGGYLVAPGEGSGNSMIFTPKWTVTGSGLYSIPTDTGTYGLAANYYYNGRYFPDPANQFPQSAYHLINASINWTSINERWKVAVWGKNLNNAEYYSNINITPLRAAGSPAAPRTYGVTFTAKWGGA